MQKSPATVLEWGGIKPVRLIFTHYIANKMKGGSIPRLLEICAIYVMCRNVNLFHFCLEPFFKLFLFQDEREIPAAARITV